MPKLFYDFTETLRRRLSGKKKFQEAIHVKHNWWFLNTEIFLREVLVISEGMKFDM